MITLNNFEAYVPYKIWQRGEEYYESGAVIDLEEISDEDWIATVQATDDYAVEVSIENDIIASWNCDCPYEGEPLLAVFNSQLKKYAESNVGRNHYEYIAKALKMMQKLKGGDEAVKQLVAEFRMVYKRRSAMMSELSKF